jgi:hypothetical protein
MSGEASSISTARVASEISRLHDTIQEGLARDEAVHDKLEALVTVLKRRTLTSADASQGDSVAVVGTDTTGHGAGGERERLRLEEEGGLPSVFQSLIPSLLSPPPLFSIPSHPLVHTAHLTPTSTPPHLHSQVRTLKLELQGTNILLQQNGQLEREIARLCVELEEVTQGVLQRGYLYKWRDRDISYASKWGLRYFVLQGSMLSYYGDDRDNSRPRRTFDMTKCLVRDEGTKKNGAVTLSNTLATLYP